jgi:hypothetical protein
MTVETTSGGDPEDLDDGESRGSPAAGDHSDLGGDGIPCVAGVSLIAEAGANGITRNRSVVTRCPRTSVAIHVDERDPSGGRRHAYDDQDGEQETAGGSRRDAGTAPTGIPNPGDKGLRGNRISTGLCRVLVRRPRVLKVLDVHRRAAEVISVSGDMEVTFHGFRAKEDGTEEEDGGWKSVGGRGDRIVSNPAIDLRPIGVKSKFWVLSDDDDSDDEIVQSPYTPDLVHLAAVHGFTKEKLVEAEIALRGRRSVVGGTLAEALGDHCHRHRRGQRHY